MEHVARFLDQVYNEKRLHSALGTSVRWILKPNMLSKRPKSHCPGFQPHGFTPNVSSPRSSLQIVGQYSMPIDRLLNQNRISSMAKSDEVWQRLLPMSQHEVDHCPNRKKVYLRLEIRPMLQYLKRAMEDTSIRRSVSLECTLEAEQAGILAEGLLRQARKAAGIRDH